ncbi:flagellar protein FlaG [Methylobacterium sp. A54F]
MSEISAAWPIGRASATPTVDPVRSTGEARASRDPKAEQRLAPAVTVDVSGNGEAARGRPDSGYEGHFIRDTDSRQMVYQMIDPASGDIILQIPDVTVLKARAYAEPQSASTSEGAVDRLA